MDNSPEFLLSDAPEKQYGEPFVIDDLLVFPADAEAEIPMVATSTVSSSCNDAQEPVGGDSYFTEEFCVPYEDLAELEWVSNFVEEDSFSTEDLRKLQIIQGIEARTNEPRSPMIPVPVKARSKRSKGDPGNWASRAVAEPGSERRCVHCATEKTPQWRSGPMGPKTLCNACGVRYKSGRLVPEYRPAASPTFVLTKHSNSHRKVVELRRQKEMARAQQQQLMNHHRHQSVMFDEAFMIHQHGFRHVT